MRLVLYIAILSAILVSTLSAGGKVIILRAECAIHPACADYIQAGIDRAVKENAECVIIELNTPGGLLASTRNIVTSILQSKIPVVIYVYPSGAQSASAGVFITLSAHIAAMAPGTNIGAAHPVTLQGQQDSVMIEKATNDAAAFIRTISEKRNRNIEWAENAVRKSLSITETEALKLNVIDLVAKDLDDLLNKIDGMKINIEGKEKILETKTAKIEMMEMDFFRKILSMLSDPNIAYILLMLGMYGILFELYNPGSIFPGVIGVISLILAFYSLNVFPVNYAGLALIILGIILFILEIKIVSHGLLTVGGIISLFLGSSMLINEQSVLEAVEISMGLIIFIVILTALFFLFAISMGIKAQRLKPAGGAEGLVGEIGTAVTDLSPSGDVKVHGEFWNAESVEGEIKPGESVEIVSVKNLKVKVKKYSNNT